MFHCVAAGLARLAGVGIAVALWAAAAPSFVGSAACKTCHADIWAGFFRNPHYRSVAAGNLAPEKTGCEGCHGPGGDHLAGKGDKTKIRAFSQIQPSQVIEACLACHSNTMGRAQIRRSSHTQAQVACNSCHGIHKPATPKHLLAKTQTELCGSCHPNVKAQFSLPFKHRVNEGFMNCADCHNPHGSAAPSWTMGARPRMVDAALANEEPCLKCHADKRGPFAFEHAAVRVDGCGSCHQPHGSMNARLLKRPATFPLCLECHNGASNFGRQGDGVQLQSSTHNMADPRYRNCTTCHVRIHGSNADARFLR